MAKLVLGKTPEDLEIEQARKEREREAEIQASIMERQKKIQALHNKQKINKIIIIASISIFTIILIVFGTYNTFFKKGLSIDDVNRAIAQNIQPFRYPSEGLDGYIRNNCENLFNKYYSISNKNKTIASVKVDPNSCYIFKVKKLNATLAQVYFSMDVIVTEKDTQVTDPVIIEQLKKNGFGVIPDANVQPVVQEPIVEETVEENSEDIENTEENTETDENEETEEPEVIEPQLPEEIPITSLDYAFGNNQEAIHYYMTANGTIMQEGSVTVQRYHFYVPVELVYGYDNDIAVTSGYRLAGEMNLYSLNETDQVNFDNITIHAAFAFNEDTSVDEDTLNKIKIKVDKTLEDLYDMRDTSQDFLNYRTFNTYDARYDGLEYIVSYTEPNQMGYNTFVVYNITTSQGFTYTLETYLLVEQSGNSYVIKQIM